MSGGENTVYAPRTAPHLFVRITRWTVVSQVPGLTAFEAVKGHSVRHSVRKSRQARGTPAKLAVTFHVAEKVTQIALNFGDNESGKFVRALLSIVTNFTAFLASAGLRAGVGEVVFVLVAGLADQCRAAGDRMAFFGADEAADWLVE